MPYIQNTNDDGPKHKGIATGNLNDTKDLLDEGLEPAEQQKPLKDGNSLVPKHYEMRSEIIEIS